MKILTIEETPNPNARKFIVDEPAKQELSFFNAESAKGYELAEKLFAISGVTTLLFLNNFITVNKSSAAKWADVIKAVRVVLEK
jgi:hypothetical protein